MIAGQQWETHKFGGTSVSSSGNYSRCAEIIMNRVSEDSKCIAVVVSAMGGKPKTTDLLLDLVKEAETSPDCSSSSISSFTTIKPISPKHHGPSPPSPPKFDSAAMRSFDYKTLDLIFDKHAKCIEELNFSAVIRETLLSEIAVMCSDIQDILKTVQILRWAPSKIGEIVSSFGEIFSAHIFEQVIRRSLESEFSDIEVMFVDARRVIDVEETSNGGKEPLQKILYESSREKLRSVLSEGSLDTRKLLVITGYIASTSTGVPTTLKRDGSDFSATIFGSLLDSLSVTIWTDVSGILSCDPRLVRSAKVLEEVSFHEAMELSYFGAKVVHPKCVQPCANSDPPIPIYIRNTFSPLDNGTKIFSSSKTHRTRELCVAAFSTVNEVAILNLEGSGMVGAKGVARRLFGALEDNNINVILIAQASSEQSISLCVDMNQAEAARKILSEVFDRELTLGLINDISTLQPCTILAAVGDGMSQTTGVCGKFFQALGAAKINILAVSQGCSERNISAVITAHEAPTALQAVHSAFHLSSTIVKVAIVMDDVDSDSIGLHLINLLEKQQPMLKTNFDADVRVVCVRCADGVLYIKEGNFDTPNDTVTNYITVNSFNDRRKLPTSAYITTNSQSSLVYIKAKDCVDMDVLVTSVMNTDVQTYIFDTTASANVSRAHASWLRNGNHVVTANNLALSNEETSRELLKLMRGNNGISNININSNNKHVGKYMVDVCIGGGLPVISTLRNLINTRDKISRIDGIFSVSASYIMCRIAPPLSSEQSDSFDAYLASGLAPAIAPTFTSPSEVESVSFSQAVSEAQSLGLMEADPREDLSNVYTARNLVILAQELGVSGITVDSIVASSDDLLGANDSDFDEVMRSRVASAREKGCVPRLISSLDVASGNVSVNLVDVPTSHQLAVVNPASECFRFFTQTHNKHPLTVAGPVSGMKNTAAAMLAEMLSMMRGNVGEQASSGSVRYGGGELLSRVQSKSSIAGNSDVSNVSYSLLL